VAAHLQSSTPESEAGGLCELKASLCYKATKKKKKKKKRERKFNLDIERSYKFTQLIEKCMFFFLPTHTYILKIL
jgi:hypothetical protein